MDHECQTYRRTICDDERGGHNARTVACRRRQRSGARLSTKSAPNSRTLVWPTRSRRNLERRSRRRDDAGQGYALKLTASGLKAIAVDEGPPDAIERGKAAQPQAKNRVSPDEGGDPARAAAPRRQQAGAGDRTSAARRRRNNRRFDSGYGMAATHDAGCARRAAQARVCRDPRTDRPGDSVYRLSGAPADRGDCMVQQRDARDGRGPKQKATQAA